jgi:hypothetical protein
MSDAIYSAVYRRIRYSASYLRLSPYAKLLFRELIDLLPPYGIACIPARVLMAELTSSTGLTEAQVRAGLAEMEDEGDVMLRRDGCVVWLVNRLAYQPSMISSRDTQRKGLINTLARLPTGSSLIDAFKQRYPDWFDQGGMELDLSDTPNPTPNPTPTHSPTHSQGIAKARANRNREGEGEGERGDKSPSPNGRARWLSPYAKAWRERFDGDPPFGQIAKHLAKLHEGKGEPVVLPAWQRFLDAQDIDHISIPKFVSGFGVWAGTAPRSPVNGPPVKEMRYDD